MKERPILFSGAMVRAILADTKRQTRRVVKLPGYAMEEREDGTLWPHCSTWSHGDDGTPWATCPYGAPGDRLYVRESVRRAPLPSILTGEPTNALCIQYVADGEFACDAHGFDYAWRWKRGALPSIHLPRDCSRITLAVESVRVERLHDITEEDARAEGVNGGCLSCGNEAPCGCVDPRPCYRDSFSGLWQEINGAESWAANPWVWVIGFSRA